MIDTKPNINNREDLLEKKARLKAKIKMRKADIGQSFSDMKDELNPLNIFSRKKGNKLQEGKRTISNLVQAAGNSPLVSMGVANATNFLLRKSLLRNAGFIPRLVVPLLVKKASEFIVAPTINHKIVSAMHDAADTIRETDIKTVLPDAKDMVPDAALTAVARTSERIADTLYDTADKIRPAEKVYVSTPYSENSNQKIAKKLRRLAARIRS